VGDPTLIAIGQYPKKTPVRISVAFSWDLPEAQRLHRAWRAHFKDVRVGGPALDDPGGEFEPGRFVKPGNVITSRGCPNRCSFCFVPGREGPIRELTIKEGWNVFDNNILACSRHHIETVFEMLRTQPKPIRFSGGLDARLLKPWHVDLLKSIRIKRMWLACDSRRGFRDLEKAGDLLADFHKEKKYCYVLVDYEPGDTPEKAEFRLMRVFNMGFMPFSMLYRDAHVPMKAHSDPEWRRLIRKWCNPARYKAFMRNQGGIHADL
jgi:hypothetical protein